MVEVESALKAVKSFAVITTFSTSLLTERSVRTRAAWARLLDR